LDLWPSTRQGRKPLIHSPLIGLSNFGCLSINSNQPLLNELHFLPKITKAILDMISLFLFFVVLMALHNHLVGAALARWF
jgi:hypothetical protein